MKVFAIASVLSLFPLLASADRFTDWDTNKDGKLQKAELPEEPRRNFVRVDTDKDGTISRSEHEAFLKRGQRKPQRARARLDPEQFRILENLDYAGTGNPRQALDLFLPVAKSGNPRPLLVFVHGGGWRKGSKDGAASRLAPFLKDDHYAGAAINYRLTDEAQWPAQIHDCKAAIRWLKAHAGELHGIDPDRIAVWGTSAGGHLVSMLGVAGDVPSLEGTIGEHRDHDSKVACVVNYFGPAYLLTMDDHPTTIKHSAADSPEGLLLGGAMKDIPRKAKDASPQVHVSKVDSPILIAHGTEDKLVPHQQSVAFAKRLEKAGVPVVFITMEGAGHGFRSAELEKRVGSFLAVHLRGAKANVSAEAIPSGK